MSIEPPHDVSDSYGESGPHHEALQEKLERLRPHGIRAAMNILHSQHHAEDVVDAVIGRLFISQAGPGGAPLDAWFLACVKNAAIDLTRSPRWCRTDDAAPADLPADEDNPLENALRNERVEAIQNALAKLSRDERDLIRMRHIDEMKLEDIAHHINLSTSATHYRLKKAEEQLRKNLKKGGGFNV
jgi:RNA polymerase sigma-70 factor (ECF subfamily)